MQTGFQLQLPTLETHTRAGCFYVHLSSRFKGQPSPSPLLKVLSQTLPPEDAVSLPIDLALQQALPHRQVLRTPCLAPRES